VKPSTELAILTEWDLREVYWGPRRALRANRAGLYMIDLVHHALTPHDPHPALFDALATALGGLEAVASVGWTLLKFQWALLVETGYQPRLGAPEGTTGAPARAFGFDPVQGGLVADPGPESAGGADAKVWRVRADTVEVLRRLEQPGSAEPGSNGQGASEGVERATRLLGAYIELTTGHRVPSGPILFDSR
jgi:recombinational DNA repair protein (RecF pathway)